MKLIIEKGDGTSLVPGEYDITDLGAVKRLDVQHQPGAYANIEIDLRLDGGMKPEPGSVGEPHFKFGVDVRDEPRDRSQAVTIFGRPVSAVGAQAFGYNFKVNDSMLHGQSKEVAEADVRAIVEPGVQAVANEIISALVSHAIERVMSPVKKTVTSGGSGYGSSAVAPARSDNQKRQDAFFGLPVKDPHKVAKCGECKGSGEWMNPANGARSPCSKGCPKP